MPLPPLKFPLGGEPRRGKPDEGKGGAPRGRGGGRGTTRREIERQSSTPSPTKRGASANVSARRRAAGAPRGRRETAGSPLRGREPERGQRPSRPDRRRGDGQRARESPRLHPTPSNGTTTHADGGTAARRAATARTGGNRTHGPAATPAASAERPIEPQQQRDRRGRPATSARSADRRHDRQPQRTEGRGTNSPAPRPEGLKAERAGRRASCRAQKRTGAAAQRANLAACAPLWRFFPLVVGSSAFPAQKNARKGEKTKKKGLLCVEQCAILVLRRV